MAKEVPTINESIKQRIEKSKRWKEANPGLDYVDDWHPQDEPKIYIT